LTIDNAIRQTYRWAWSAARRSEDVEPPDPFTASGYREFLEFLNEADPRSSLAYSRYVWALYCTRPGLDRVFPDVHRADRSGFVDWLRRYARIEDAISPLIEMPAWPARWRVAVHVRRRRGVNIAGYLTADMGLGVAVRRLVAAFESASIPIEPVDYRRTFSRQSFSDTEGTHDVDLDTNLICVTAEQLPLFRHDIGEAFFERRYSIGYWYWELEEFPVDQQASLDLVDEVWVGTEHVRRAVASVTGKPVIHAPIPLTVPATSARTKSDFGLPDRYTFLFAFDFQSILERKNPAAVIEAFRLAFPRVGTAQLVLKTMNGHRWVRKLEEMKCAALDRADIVVVDRYFSDLEHADLVNACDCYVSLHRAEGLGLTLADAMALGKPTIATRYSGNLDFMHDTNSLLVDYEMTTVPLGVPAYRAGAPWADPDIEHAARLMRELVDDPNRGVELGRKAAEDIRERWNVQVIGRQLKRQLEEAWHRADVSRA
jgi:glycosyltransferase involved in cell wall biosynthesis